MSDEIILFVKNKDKGSPILDGTEPVFSVPYPVIRDAQDFCCREDLKHCFVTMQNGRWIYRSSLNNVNNEFVVVVTKDSFYSIDDNYIYKVVEYY